MKRQAVAPPAMSGSVDDADVCQTLSDYHGVASRVVFGILFRQYLDGLVLTPSEVIHGARAMKALMEQGTLLENAMTRVAMVQARTAGQDQKGRRAALQAALTETAARARAAQVAFAGQPRGVSAAEWVMGLPPGRTPTGDAGYDRRVAVAIDLAEHRTWTDKLDRVLELLRRDRDERLLPALDGVLADLLVTPVVVQDLIGGPAILPGVLFARLCGLVLGDTASVSSAGGNRAAVLNGLLRQGKLPQVRAGVLERLRRHLRAPQPLGRGAPAEEGELLNALLGHLLTAAGVVGDVAMAEAVTVRYSRRLEQGGASAFRRSIVGVAEMQADLFTRIHYLAAVARSPAAGRHLGEIVAALDAALGNELLVDAALTRTVDLVQLRELLSGAAGAVRAAPLPGEAVVRIVGRIEHLLDDAARQGRLFVRLRQVEGLPRRRMIRLAELACSGLLSEEGGIPAVRQHIMETVRQPQFQADLAAPDSSEVAQIEVRRLVELLDRLRQISGAGTPAPTVAAAPDPAIALTPAATVAVAAPRRTATTVPTPRSPAGGTRMAETIAAPAALGATVAVGGEAAPRCPNCLADKSAPGDCPACGYPGSSDHRAGIHLTPGTALHDRYRVGRLLGQGGFGATYLGWDARLQVKVAVKEYYPANLISRVPGTPRVVPFSDTHAEGFSIGLGKFLEEARTLAALRDIKEIVVVQDYFEENATAYLVMELLQGRTLKRYMVESGGSLDAKRALSILAPIMRALQQVHDQGLIHRDVSPDNIFITASGERKLLDFGAARHAAGQAAGLTVILKPGYAPPEQYSPDGRQGPWTDVYAMCATLYCALTGKAPPDATSRFMRDAVPRPSETGAVVPPAFEKVLLAGLAMRHTDRPQSMRDLMKGLGAAFG